MCGFVCECACLASRSLQTVQIDDNAVHMQDHMGDFESSNPFDTDAIISALDSSGHDPIAASKLAPVPAASPSFARKHVRCA